VGDIIPPPVVTLTEGLLVINDCVNVMQAATPRWDLNLAAQSAAEAVERAQRKGRAAAAAATQAQGANWANAAAEWVKQQQVTPPAQDHILGLSLFGSAVLDESIGLDGLRPFLEELGLVHWCSTLYGRGFKTVDSLREVTKPELRQLGLLPGHVKLLQQAVASTPKAVQQPAVASFSTQEPEPAAAQPLPSEYPVAAPDEVTEKSNASSNAAAAAAAAAVAMGAAAAAAISHGSFQSKNMKATASQAAKKELKRQKDEAAAEEMKATPPMDWRQAADPDAPAEGASQGAEQRPPLLEKGDSRKKDFGRSRSRSAPRRRLAEPPRVLSALEAHRQQASAASSSSQGKAQRPSVTGAAAAKELGTTGNNGSISSRHGGWDALSAPADEAAARERLRQFQYNDMDMETKIASQLLSAATMKARNGQTAAHQPHAVAAIGSEQPNQAGIGVAYDPLRAAQIKAASRLMSVPAQSYVPFRSGDWLCPLCNAHNYKSKQRCYRCIVGVKPIC